MTSPLKRPSIRIGSLKTSRPETVMLRPTAILVYNDLTAVGVLRALAECRVRVPDEMAIVGTDGIELGRYTTPSLTTIDHPRMGRRDHEPSGWILHELAEQVLHRFRVLVKLHHVINDRSSLVSPKRLKV